MDMGGYPSCRCGVQWAVTRTEWYVSSECNFTIV